MRENLILNPRGGCVLLVFPCRGRPLPCRRACRSAWPSSSRSCARRWRRAGSKAGSAMPLIVLAWTRLRRLSPRFAALAAAVREGRLAAARTARGRAAPGPARAPRAPQPQRLPRGSGWLIRLVPEAPAYGSLVLHWLDDPELATLLAEAPQAGRILRPLCRMLAIEPGPALRAARREPPASSVVPAPSGGPELSGGRPPDAPLGSGPRAGRLLAAPGPCPVSRPRGRRPAARPACADPARTGLSAAGRSTPIMLRFGNVMRLVPAGKSPHAAYRSLSAGSQSPAPVGATRPMLLAGAGAGSAARRPAGRTAECRAGRAATTEMATAAR